MNVIPGNTELIELKHIESTFKTTCRIYGKVENTNPSGSIKDRAVYQMLLGYQQEGKLVKGGIVIEATSGNTGISLAFFQRVFDYKAVILMPKSMSKERRDKIASYGAQLVLIDGGMKQCEDEAIALQQKTPNSLIFGQFENENNPLAHYLTTGPEIAKQLDKVDYIFAGFGTGGTVSGLGRYFKEHKTNTKIIGVEPRQSPLLTKGVASPHLIQGIGANFIPQTLHREYIDEIVDVDDKASIEMAKTIRKIEKIDIGISSGAALLCALNYIKEHNLKEGNIVVIFPDKGDRYKWTND